MCAVSCCVDVSLHPTYCCDMLLCRAALSCCLECFLTWYCCDADIIFTLLFTVECTFKIVAWGPYEYFTVSVIFTQSINLLASPVARPKGCDMCSHASSCSGCMELIGLLVCSYWLPQYVTRSSTTTIAMSSPCHRHAAVMLWKDEH